MEDFKDLKVWAKAHQLCLSVYRQTQSFPRAELYGLSSQLRRCAASIGANIAEGAGRRSDGELHRFLQIARGSASELEYHLLLARDLGFLQPVTHREMQQQTAEVQRMLSSLAKTVRPDGKQTAAPPSAKSKGVGTGS